MQILPLPQIFRAVQQNASTLLANSGTNTEIPDVAIPPKKRIAKTSEQGIRRRFDDGIFPFGPSAKLRVGGGGQALHFAEGMRAIAQGGRFRRGGAGIVARGAASSLLTNSRREATIPTSVPNETSRVPSPRREDGAQRVLVRGRPWCQKAAARQPVQRWRRESR